MIEIDQYLRGSTVFISAVLVGFVPVSKLNAFGLSECGDAVVEFANHNFESVPGLEMVEADAVALAAEFVLGRPLLFPTMLPSPPALLELPAMLPPAPDIDVLVPVALVTLT